MVEGHPHGSYFEPSDENGASHIAFGSAYRTALRGGERMTETELRAIGCNNSSEHYDVMISDVETTVTATTFGGKDINLIKDGEWVSEFL